jgi:pantothenate kinase
MTEIPDDLHDLAGGPQPRDGLSDEALAVAAGALRRWRNEGKGVTVVAVDGHGAAGKTTIAQQLSALSGASVVHTDDFWEPESEARTGIGIGRYYDVGRLRREAIEPLRAGRDAFFSVFDWERGALSSRKTHVSPSDLVIVEGVYSAAPLLADLVDRAIYVDTPEEERLARLAGRVAPGEWDWDWLAAEGEYFSASRPAESFDLVICGSATGPTLP